MVRSRSRFWKTVTTMIASTILASNAASAGCLRGVNLAGAEFGDVTGVYGKDYIYPSDATISYFAQKGFNAVRLPFRWEHLQPELNKAFDAGEHTRLTEAIGRLKRAGLIVILDVHNYARYRGELIGSGSVPNSAFADFWKRLAGEYRNDPAVQFGLMNEPYDMAATQWLSAANAAIAAIRQAGASNLILVPGTNWTGAHSWLNDDPEQANSKVMLGVEDAADNYAYEVHQYLDSDFSGTHKTCARAADALTALKDFTAWLQENGKRGFLGEFGGSPDKTCMDGITAMADFIGKNPESWTGWTYWAGGDWWPENEELNIQPTKAGDRPQLKALQAAGAIPAAKGACPALERKG